MTPIVRSLELDPETATSTTASDHSSSLQQALAWMVAMLAVAGGLIHLKASIDHRDLTLIAIWFASIGISQLVLTAVLVVRPTWTVFHGGGILHAGIALVWILTRTVGLGFVPGPEQGAQVGVADVVANTFSIAVVGATGIG